MFIIHLIEKNLEQVQNPHTRDQLFFKLIHMALTKKELRQS